MSNAATTETRTEYGIRKPNGEIHWNKAGRYLNIDVEGAAKDGKTYDGRRAQYVESGRAAMIDAMRAKAKEVGIVQEDFIHGHEYVTRDIITITMAPATVPDPPINVQF